MAAILVVLLLAVATLNVLDYYDMGPVESMRGNVRNVSPGVFDTLFPSSAMKHAAELQNDLSSEENSGLSETGGEQTPTGGEQTPAGDADHGEGGQDGSDVVG